MKKSNSCARNANLHSPGLLIALALFLAGLLSGCVSSQTALQAPRTADGPAMNLARGLYERADSLQSLAARGGATYTEGQRRNYVKFEIVMMKPKFRFTAFDPAGRPAFRLAFDGQEIYGLMYGSREYISGPGNVEKFGAFLPLDISPEQLLGIISGGQVQPAAAAGDFDGRSTELLVEPVDMPNDEDHLWRVKVLGELSQDPRDAILETAAYGPARKPLISFRYSAVKPVPREDVGGRPEPFPHFIEAEWLGRKSLRLTYDEVRLGLPVTDDLFKLERPEGFELIHLQ